MAIGAHFAAQSPQNRLRGTVNKSTYERACSSGRMYPAERGALDKVFIYLTFFFEFFLFFFFFFSFFFFSLSPNWFLWGWLGCAANCFA
jgi:hypothetical protein